MSAQLKSALAWFEIPVTDIDRGMDFYGHVVGASLTKDLTGPNPMAMFAYAEPGVGGHLYEGKPASANGPTIHLGIEGSLEEAIDRMVEKGGKKVTDIITIPAGRFAYGLDPDGNSIGLFTR